MAYDAQHKPASAFTPHAELTPDQRARYGAYVLAKEQFTQRAAYNADRYRRAGEALKATGGDKLAALGLMLNGGV
jgi:hypothetical protein